MNPNANLEQCLEALGTALRSRPRLTERAMSELRRSMAEGRPEMAAAARKRFFNQGRELMRRPIPRVIAATAACLLAFMVWSLFPDRQPTAQAFDAFAKALVDARSASFKKEVKANGEIMQKWRCYYLAPGKVREEAAGFFRVTDAKAGKIVTVRPGQKTAVVVNNARSEPGDPEADMFEQLRELLSERRGANRDEFERLGEKEMRGRRAIGFSHTYWMGKLTLTLWGDPATGLPVLVEFVVIVDPGRRVEITMSDFKLNENLDPALFDMTPPADYEVRSVDFAGAKPAEQTLIEALRVVTDWNEGRFPDNLDTVSATQLIRDKATRAEDRKSKGMTPEVTALFMKVGRGMTFALDLPESADAHYAGKGVKRDEPNRPIFWYKPEGANRYRVIYADLSVKEADVAPEVAGAVRVERRKPPVTRAQGTIK